MREVDVSWNALRSLDRTPSDEGGAGHIESADDCWLNIRWQSREREPSQGEMELALALEGIFQSGVESLEGVVEKLNASALVPPDGSSAWTTQTLITTVEAFGGAGEPKLGGRE